MPPRVAVSDWNALAALRAGDGPGRERLRAGITGLLLKKPADQARVDRLLADWRKAPAPAGR